MAVVDIRKQVKRSGVSGLIDDQVYNERYWIKCDSYTDNMLTILVDPLFLSTVPGFGEGHPDNIFFTRRNIRWEAGSPLHWYANVEWSTRPLTTEEKEKEEFPNPVDRRVRMSGSSEEFQIYRDKDRAGNPYVNSAGDPLEAEPFEDSRIVLPLRRNVATWDNSWFSYNNKVNDADIQVTDGKSTLVILKGFGLFKGFGMSDLKEENGFQFYEASGQLHIATDTEDKWNRPRLDQGFYDSSGNKLTEKGRDGTEQDTTVEQLMDGEGGQLTRGDDPVYLEFEDVVEADFTNLPFFTIPE